MLLIWVDIADEPPRNGTIQPMIFRKSIFFALALALVSPGAGRTALADVFGAREAVLDNGLRIVVVENSRAPVVTHMVWYRAGAMDEPPGRSGIAHFLEHLMFKGTDTRAAGEFSDIVARNGGQENAFTSQDYTAYYQSVASDRLELVMSLEADRMANLNIDPAHFEPERSVVLEERSQRTDSDPSSILWEQTGAALYRNHPYGIPIIGWRHEIEELRVEDAIEFYDRYYAPNNAILVVSGDTTLEEVVGLAETYYGPIPAADLPERPVWREPPMPASTVVTYRDPRVQQPTLAIQRLAPSWGTHATDTDRIYALQVLSEILGGGSTSLLYRGLVVDQAVAVSAGSWYSGSVRGPGSFGFYVSPRGGVDLDVAEDSLRTAVDRILSDGITEDEVTRAITRLQDAAVTALDSLSGPANQIGRALTVGIPLSEIEAWPDRIGAVTVDQVNDALRDVLAGEGEVVGRLLTAQDQGADEG